VKQGSEHLVSERDLHEHLAVAQRLAPDMVVELAWTHDYVTVDGASGPDRPVKMLQTLCQPAPVGMVQSAINAAEDLVGADLARNPPRYHVRRPLARVALSITSRPHGPHRMATAASAERGLGSDFGGVREVRDQSREVGISPDPATYRGVTLITHDSCTKTNECG